MRGATHLGQCEVIMDGWWSIFLTVIAIVQEVKADILEIIYFCNLITPRPKEFYYDRVSYCEPKKVHDGINIFYPKKYKTEIPITDLFNQTKLFNA